MDIIEIEYPGGMDVMRQDVLVEKTNSVQNCLKRIHDTVKGDTSRVSNVDVQDILVLNLQRAVQLTIDMAAYIISTQNLGIPKSLKDLFQILEQNKYIRHEICEKMQKMVEFRDIAVHDYQAINLEILKSVITHHLKDFEEFYSAIIKRISKN